MSKVPDIRLNEMAGNLWRDGKKAAVTHRGDFFDLPMVILNEFQMCH